MNHKILIMTALVAWSAQAVANNEFYIVNFCPGEVLKVFEQDTKGINLLGTISYDHNKVFKSKKNYLVQLYNSHKPGATNAQVVYQGKKPEHARLLKISRDKGEIKTQFYDDEDDYFEGK